MAATVQRVEDQQTWHALLPQAITCPTLGALRMALAGSLEQAMRVVYA
jgi:hypothetical protein